MKSFNETVKLHFKAIDERDLDAYAQFLHPSLNCIVILADGSVVEGYDNIINIHREWFKDLSWRMDIKTVDIFTVDDIVGYALLDVIYSSPDFNRHRYLSLMFQKFEGKWILVRDQNTPIL